MWCKLTDNTALLVPEGILYSPPPPLPMRIHVRASYLWKRSLICGIYTCYIHCEIESITELSKRKYAFVACPFLITINVDCIVNRKSRAQRCARGKGFNSNVGFILLICEAWKLWNVATTKLRASYLRLDIFNSRKCFQIVRKFLFLILS